jgi:hypothetical protein
MESSKSRVRALALVVCALLMPLLQARAAQFVEVTADLQSVRWLYQGRNVPPSVVTKNWKTRCVVGTNTWLIEGAFPPAQHAWWFTGSNINDVVWELNLTASGEITGIAVGGPPEIPTEAQRKVEK